MDFLNNNELFLYLKKFENAKNIVGLSSWQIITANDRLSRYLQKQYQKFNQHSVIPAPPIISLDQWLNQFYETLIGKRIITPKQRLNHWQTQLLWAEAIMQYGKNLSTQLMEEAYQAYSLLLQYFVPIDTLTLSHHDPSQLLLTWIHAYQTRCQQLDVIDSNHLMQQVIQSLESEIAQTNKSSELSSVLPQHIFFIGFDIPSPYLQRLTDRLIQWGISCDFTEINKKEMIAQGIIFKNSEEELQAMLRHALEILTVNSDQHVGCVLPNPLTQRHTIKQILSRLSNEYPLAHESILNFSVGPCLIDYPLTQYVQHVISLNPDRCLYAEFSLFLLSPYCPGAAIERFQRAEFDIFLRKQESYHLSFNYIIQLLDSSKFSERCPILLSTLIKTIEFQNKIKEKLMNPSGWIHHFNNALQIFLPDELLIDTTEMLILQKIISVIEKLATLDVITGEISYARAVYILKKTYTTTIYQPRNKFAKIHIMGTLEASGMSFDYLWISGLHSENWPAAPIANSFLPIMLQRKYSMPHCSLDREFKFTQKITYRLLHSAQHIVLSMQQRENDEPLLPSPFLVDYFNQQTISNSTIIPNHWMKLWHNRTIEHITDNRVSEISLQNPFKTGSRVFELQAQCPFRAFAMLRLHCQATPLPTPGISVRLRGNLIHHCLEMIWTDLKNHHNLTRKSESTLLSLVAQYVDRSISKFKKCYPLVFRKKICSIEKSRLMKIIFSWLVYEKNRAPFSVFALEHKISLMIGSLHLSLKIDRIDQISLDNMVVIDYKTGTTNINTWFGERPENLQLPLYSLAYPDTLAALAFASLKPNAITFKGITSIEHLLPNLLLATNLPSMNGNTIQQQQKIWKSQLEKLSEEFCSGTAHVAPLHESICKKCDLMHLCRIRQC